MGSIKGRNGMDLTEAEDIKKRWQEYTEELYKKDLNDPDNHDSVITHLEPDRHLGVQSQVGLRKHHYEQSYGRWWNSSWAISNSKRWCCESAALNMPANLENSAVATGLEKVSFHSNSKERQGQRMSKLLHNCPHFTCQQSNAQNSPSQVSTLCELWTSRFKLDLEKAEEPEIKLPTSLVS